MKCYMQSITFPRKISLCIGWQYDILNDFKGDREDTVISILSLNLMKDYRDLFCIILTISQVASFKWWMKRKSPPYHKSQVIFSHAYSFFLLVIPLFLNIFLYKNYIHLPHVNTSSFTFMYVVDSQCRDLITALNAWAARAYFTTARLIAT